MRTIIAILPVVITGCAQAHAQTPSQSQGSHRPSATEIFELQA
jgi:predicted outer membrane protein